MNKLGVLCVGRMYCDLNFAGIDHMPVLGQEVFTRNLTLHAGGGAFITASYFAALGLPAHVMGMLPSPPFASLVEAEALSNSVNLYRCEHDPDASPQLTVAMPIDEERAFLTNRQGQALPDNYAAALDESVGEGSVSHLHIGELATLIEYPNLVKRAKRARLSVSLDCGWDDECFDNPAIDDLIAQVDVFLPNEAEMLRLKQLGIRESISGLTVVKKGAAGATVFSEGREHSLPANRQTVVDTIGAGDAFNAGFVSAWRDGCSPVQCLAIGNACGAVAVSRAGGATSLPDLTHIMAASYQMQINNQLRPA